MRWLACLTGQTSHPPNFTTMSGRTINLSPFSPCGLHSQNKNVLDPTHHTSYIEGVKIYFISPKISWPGGNHAIPSLPLLGRNLQEASS
jgi:hypothetical protein